jgi:hypothetical protein
MIRRIRSKLLFRKSFDGPIGAERRAEFSAIGLQSISKELPDSTDDVSRNSNRSRSHFFGASTFGVNPGVALKALT